MERFRTSFLRLSSKDGINWETLGLRRWEEEAAAVVVVEGFVTFVGLWDRVVGSGSSCVRGSTAGGEATRLWVLPRGEDSAVARPSWIAGRGEGDRGRD